MTRSKDSIYSGRHDRHIARNGQTEARYGIKKMGAGTANWGVLGDEIPDAQEIAHAQEVHHFQYGKLNLVDSETFATMRSSEQAS
ncbi:uncharacterized protein B0P05DRAFT_558275 [Gilbertella persicaria]|uniref:uncharacterized protein n=1 Tax=Gilbertella persicaria TaxID=101096 RepID=UPI00221F2219|nr:uncharacterized protein B0P05DRAFT_558275 [Gilbertella persicaria]KAI8059983.1 hypothetical protein B0P05DRAFT_558275 [Gilbertella persicaria]